jgi:hypothetical protein
MSRDIIQTMTQVKGVCDYFPGVDGGTFPLPTGSRRWRGPPDGRLLWEREERKALGCYGAAAPRKDGEGSAMTGGRAPKQKPRRL